MVKKYSAKVEQHINLIDDIYTVEFSSLKKPFKYSPGQFLHLAIDAYDGAGQWPESRCFSMQSSPNESHVKITYAAKGGFTQRMSEELKTGKEVWLKMAYGSLFENEHDQSNSVFIAGGTGITPFLSLFTDPSFADYSNPALFFGVREKKYLLYNNELTRASEINTGFKSHLFVENKNGRPEMADILNTHSIDSSFFISGPPAMIAFYKQELQLKGVKESNLLTDDWE
jgi:ferredoxin-NADP reductase